MSGRVMDGRALAAQILDGVAERISRRVAAGGSRPHLSVVLVGDDPASEAYVRGKRRDGEMVGITSTDHRLPASASTAEVVALVAGLNRDSEVSGVLVQQPLPPQVDVSAAVAAVDPAKDVDGFHPINAGRLLLGQPATHACTPAGIMRLLDAAGVPLEGSRAVVVGRSNFVGKPVAILLLERNATVTICHSRTRDLASITRQADVLVAAIGSVGFITPDMVKPGAAVVDVGITRVDGRLQGDVAPGVAEVAGWITPVPGGVGPMTRAMLLSNTLEAEERRKPLA